jgi:hypothetical protein
VSPVLSKFEVFFGGSSVSKREKNTNKIPSGTKKMIQKYVNISHMIISQMDGSSFWFLYLNKMLFELTLVLNHLLGQMPLFGNKKTGANSVSSKYSRRRECSYPKVKLSIT